MIYEQFKKGINIGSWLSQYDIIAEKPLTEDSLRQHFDSFIKEDDIRQIASWQFDHIRLPISGYLIYDVEGNHMNSDTLEYLYKCIINHSYHSHIKNVRDCYEDHFLRSEMYKLEVK